MKYYKLKTVAFYIFIATIMSFDLKGSENGNEVICPCCCSDEWEKKGEKEEGEEDTKDEKKKENKDEEKKEGEEGEGGEGGNDGEGGREDEGEDEGEDEDEDDEKNFISELEQCFYKVIKGKKHKNYFGNNKKEKKRLFIVDLNNVLNEIIFEELDDKLSDFFSYKESVTEEKLPLDNLSLISYCPKDENNKKFEIREFEMKTDSTIKGVFDYFENASTWVNKECLILFIKDQDNNIVSLVPYTGFFKIYKENN